MRGAARLRAAVRLILIATAMTALCSALAGRAFAHDTLAPAGASHNWLPDEEWVHRHWVPFDEDALKGALGLTRRDLHAYLHDDHHTLADLARRRGLDAEVLAERLVAPWQGISAEHRATLRERALRVLTQGHLAQHVFFHVFHGLNLIPVAPDLFGMSSRAYRSLREGGSSYIEIAARGGVSESALRSGMASLLATDHDDGILREEAWPAESDRILARARAWMPCWLRQPAPRLDQGNPYGKNLQLHGRHAADWPGNASERRADERRVERFRRRLPASCWQRPPRWSWTAHGLVAP